MTRILLSFVGFHDPYSDGVVEGQRNAGPVLSAMGHARFDHVFLFDTPRTVEMTRATVDAVTRRFPGTRVEIVDMKLDDPTDYAGILAQLRRQFSRIEKAHLNADFFVSISSGTPQMQSCWLLLAASGEIPATLLQPQPPQFVSDPAKAVKVIDLDNPAFPEIRTGTTAEVRLQGDQGREALVRDLGIVGDCAPYRTALDRVMNLAPYDVNVLLLGETGSGKELFARLLHQAGPRKSKPLVSINCAAYPETLLDSQLFGHERGAFTGAATRQTGKFEMADGGILFLDEIGELPIASQSKLLRALEHGEIEPLGAGRPKKVNVRVVAATNRNVKDAIKQREFREDLYFRFGGVVEIPPLRERRSDIAPLAQHALIRWNQTHENTKCLSATALRRLRQYPWPGNVRELIKVVEDAAIMTAGKIIRDCDLRFDAVPSLDTVELLPEPHEGFDLERYQRHTRRQLIERALGIAHGNQAQAARLLGLSHQAVNRFAKTNPA
jgi:DNA-binding NtrC family response regulator